MDKAGFCTAFKNTVDFAWREFAAQCPSRGDAADRCVAAAIIGYDLKHSTFDPGKCTKCPSESEADCPRQCALEAQRNESVQALQRGLPWTPGGDPAKCGACPSATSCASSCILPVVISPDAKLYHRDKFLHFWAEYQSVYNLNPFARFVHNYDQGLAAPGAYSFSIDDFYGNFGGPGSALLVDVGCTTTPAGCTTTLPNKEPFDPFKQYRAGLGTGWHHATVCGRRLRSAGDGAVRRRIERTDLVLGQRRAETGMRGATVRVHRRNPVCDIPAQGADVRRRRSLYGEDVFVPRG